MRWRIMGKNFKISLVMLYIFGLIFGMGTAASAEEDQPDTGGFSFEVVRPDNQINPNVTYYDLGMKPGQKQTVVMKLNNTSDEEITVLVEANRGITNSGGVIEYVKIEDKDPSLKFDFSEVVTVPDEVVLEPNSSKELNIEINMPKTSFEGYLAGGIRLQQKDQESNQNGMVINKFAYMVGMLLSEGKTDGIPEKVEFNRVYAGSSNYRNTIFVDYSNVQPNFLDNVTTDVQISAVDSEEVLYEAKKSQMNMAPNSAIRFPVSMNGQEMIPGDYTARVLVTTAQGGRWEWKENFTITDEEADKFNESDLSLVQDPGINWRLILMIVGGAVALFVIILIIIMILKKRKKEKQKAERRKRQAKKKTKK